MEGMDAVKRNLAAALRNMVAEAEAAGDETAHLFESYAKSTAPFMDRTGNLRNSIKGSSEHSGGSVTVAVSASMEYGPFVELGTSRSAPYAFLWPTVAANADRALGIFTRHMKL